MGIAVGIDLGTSNSVVAVVRDGQPVVLGDSEGRRIHPSVVAFGYGQSVVVGHRARLQLSRAPESTVYSVKRLMGRRFDDPQVQRFQRRVPWGITEGPHGDARIRVQGRIYAPPEISAHVLAHMKTVAEEATGQQVDAAVITVPAFFNDQQRQATRDAATIAGIECLRIINEPTAASLAYGFREGKRLHLAVYDLGGGTFDISILRLDDDVFEVVSTAGDTFLGGDDFDEVIARHLAEHLRLRTGVDVSGQYVAMVKLREAAERAKRALGERGIVEVHVPAIARDAGGRTVDLEATLDLATVRQLTLPLMQRTFVVCDDAIKEAGLSPRQIDQVLLVGGMTRFPPVREAVGHYFGMTPIDATNPDEVVAIGAAIQAHNLTSYSDTPHAVLLDVTPQTLGIRTVGGFVEPLIPRNTPIPTEQSKVFFTAHDNQTEVRIRVYQGESRMASDNELLGEFVLGDLRPAPRGEVRIRVTFAIDADGIVKVTAEDIETGRSMDLLIEASSRLTEEEIDEMRFDDLDF